MLKSLIEEAGVPLKQVRLLRHHDPKAKRSTFALWQRDPPAFEAYQRMQNESAYSRLRKAPFWVSFVATPAGETLFVGIYRAANPRRNAMAMPVPVNDDIAAPGTLWVFDVERDDAMSEYSGRLLIEWGRARPWIQNPLTQQKIVSELRKRYEDPPFPGPLNVCALISEIPTLPLRWSDALRSAKGVYLLVHPKNGTHYVGLAKGSDGFLGRWLTYAATQHGGNVGLKGDPADYQVSILEVAGSAATDADIVTMERRWMQKLQSRAVGMNRN